MATGRIIMVEAGILFLTVLFVRVFYIRPHRWVLAGLVAVVFAEMIVRWQVGHGWVGVMNAAFAIELSIMTAAMAGGLLAGQLWLMRRGKK